MQAQITEIAQKFFTLMSITIEEIIVVCQDEKKGIFQIQVKTPDSKVLIGIHGQTLDMTRHLLSRIIEKTLGTSLLIHLEVNDYLQAKDEKFYRYLDSRVAYAMRMSTEITLPNLTSYERKKAHNYISLKNIEGLKTFSVGEEKERTLHMSYVGPVGTITHSISTPPVKKVPASKKVSLTIEEEGIGI